MPPRIIPPLTTAIAALHGRAWLDRLIDLVGASVAHDKVTVVRYSATARPEFVSWRNYSPALVAKYLETFYAYDPFYALWRAERRPGIVHLDQRPEDRRAPYIADFLQESGIVDEIGVLLEDGGDWALGIFLDRARRRYSRAEIEQVRTLFPLFEALHRHDILGRGEVARRTDQPPADGIAPSAPRIEAGEWPELTAREREIVAMVLSGHPPLGIASRLGISPGTVKNHRRNIYQKLDITSERELFLRHLHGAARGTPGSGSGSGGSPT